MGVNFIDIAPSDAHPDGFSLVDGASAVAWAQTVYTEIFTKLADIAWPDDPRGPLSYHWNNPRGQSATMLINLATTLKRLHDNRTRKSNDVFWSKVRGLLRPPSDDAFEQLLVELEVGSELALLTSPVSFEVFVPEELHFGASKPKSPDYGLKYFDTLITVEVTVWCWEAAFAWNRLQEQIGSTLSARLQKLGVQRALRLELPVTAEKSARQLFTTRDLCSEIAATSSGFVEHDVGCSMPGRLTWNSFEFRNDPHLGFIMMSPDGTGTSAGPQFSHRYSWSANPCLSEDSMDGALKSLRKAIERKKGQAPPQGVHAPYLVAMSLASGRTDWGMFAPLIRERIWGNPKYCWLSGIIEFTPNRYVARHPEDFSLALNVNPNAEFPVPVSFINGQKCHWPLTG